ncbi:MAG: hypothetical protein LBH07_08370, partial [Treponema sp.]|nr:hypothetical protein [Treponema sp.]
YQVHDAIPRIFLIRTILPNWEIITGEPKPIITLAMDLPEPFRSNAINNGIGSIQIIPLDSNGNHWGFISFSICTNDRFCSFKEGEILRSGGNLIAATIDRAQRKKPY